MPEKSVLLTYPRDIYCKWHNRSIMPYGTLVEVISGKDDLLHISEIGWKRLETVVLVKIVMIAGLAGSTETKIRSYTLIYNPG